MIRHNVGTQLYAGRSFFFKTITIIVDVRTSTINVLLSSLLLLLLLLLESAGKPTSIVLFVTFGFSWWSLRVLTPCYSLIQFGTQLGGLGRIRGTNTSFSCYNSVGAAWKNSLEKSVATASVYKQWARNNAEQTSFPLLATYRGCVFSVSCGDAEPSSDPYVDTYYIHYTTTP
jgi:hypothetical protein